MISVFFLFFYLFQSFDVRLFAPLNPFNIRFERNECDRHFSVGPIAICKFYHSIDSSFIFGFWRFDETISNLFGVRCEIRCKTDIVLCGRVFLNRNQRRKSNASELICGLKCGVLPSAWTKGLPGSPSTNTIMSFSFAPDRLMWIIISSHTRLASKQWIRLFIDDNRLTFPPSPWPIDRINRLNTIFQFTVNDTNFVFCLFLSLFQMNSRLIHNATARVQYQMSADFQPDTSK